MDILDKNKEDPVHLDPHELIDIGVKLGQSGQYEEALRVFDLYLSIDPWNALVINNKADCYLHLGRLDEGLDLIYYALTLNPILGIGWCTLGEIQTKSEEYFSARLNLELSIELLEKEGVHYKFAESHLAELTKIERETEQK